MIGSSVAFAAQCRVEPAGFTDSIDNPKLESHLGLNLDFECLCTAPQEPSGGKRLVGVQTLPMETTRDKLLSHITFEIIGMTVAIDVGPMPTVCVTTRRVIAQ